MKKPFIRIAETDPKPTAATSAARLASWFRSLLARRVWILLPGREQETGQALVLPFSLARLLNRRAHELDSPVEALLPVLLRRALRDRCPPDPVEQAWLSLTEREREVACLMAAGLTNRQIAARLTISHTTVRTHARGIVRKFGCPNRQSLPDLRRYCGPGEQAVSQDGICS